MKGLVAGMVVFLCLAVSVFAGLADLKEERLQLEVSFSQRAEKIQEMQREAKEIQQEMKVIQDQWNRKDAVIKHEEAKLLDTPIEIPIVEETAGVE